MLNREQLEDLSTHELITLAMWQENCVTEIRGYSSGLDEEKLAFLDRDTLIRCAIKMDDDFNLNTDLDEICRIANEDEIIRTMLPNETLGDFLEHEDK